MSRVEGEKVGAGMRGGESSSTTTTTTTTRPEKMRRMEEGGGGDGDVGEKRRPWDDMSPQVLGLIFSRLPSDEVMRSVAFVCRSWVKALFWSPDCWDEIDVQKWGRRLSEYDKDVQRIDMVVGKLVGFTTGSLRRLSAYRVGNESLVATANRGGNLSVLHIPMSLVTDSAMVKCVPSFSNLTVLDISCCMMITHQGIEAVGRHCRSLIQLRRNMPPPQPSAYNGSYKEDETEALAVADNMPGLQHLDLCFGKFTDHGLLWILTKCGSLSVLDIRGCWNVLIGDVELKNKCFQIRHFKEPRHDEIN